MTVKKKSRVVFYSINDGAAIPNLEKAEELLENFTLDNHYKIADILEIYHIKQYFDNGLFLKKWTEDQYMYYKKVVNESWDVMKKDLFQIDTLNICQYLDKVKYDYEESFWNVIELLNIFKKIEKETFSLILKKYDRYISYILSCPNIVKYFSSEIRVFLMTYKRSAELILGSFEEKDRSSRYVFHFPKNLSLADKELIMSNYLESSDANLNYVRLIVTSRDSAALKLSAKLRLKAKNKSIELNNQILEHGYSWKEGVGVGIAKEQEDIIKVTRKGNSIETLYSENYLNDQQGFIALFNVFANLFHYTNPHRLIELVSYPSELDVMELIAVKSKNEYLIGTAFIRKKMKSFQDLILYEGYLVSRNLSLELVIKGFVDELVAHFQVDNFRFDFPSGASSYVEKIRILAPDFEFMLKQYQTFVEEGIIDFELLELQSTPVNFSDIPSLCNKKYIYVKGDSLEILKNQFFSSQAHLHYIEPYKGQYHNLFSLLTNEDVKLDQFRSYQIDTLRGLIDKEFLHINEAGFVKLRKVIFIIILGDFHKGEVLSYWNYPIEFRNVIDQMIIDGLVSFENKLFTRAELKYLNFYLNKKEFTNGLDLRNKYLHGTNSTSETAQKKDYYMFLKTLILVLIKIQDDLVNNKYGEL